MHAALVATCRFWHAERPLLRRLFAAADTEPATADTPDATADVLHRLLAPALSGPAGG